MNKAKGEYELNGWLIMASEMYNDWDCFPKDLSDSQWDEFNNNECKTFKRLAEAKKFVKTIEADELKEKYSKVEEDKEVEIELIEIELSCTSWLYYNGVKVSRPVIGGKIDKIVDRRNGGNKVEWEGTGIINDYNSKHSVLTIEIK